MKGLCRRRSAHSPLPPIQYQHAPIPSIPTHPPTPGLEPQDSPELRDLHAGRELQGQGRQELSRCKHDWVGGWVDG